MNIQIISGSPRQQSKTRRIALFLQNWLQENTKHETGLVDMKDWELPAVQQVFRSVAETPEPYRALSERIFGADAFILVTPEYNGSYSPAMKNMLDYYPKQLHKAFGIVTASPGALGGIRAAQQLLQLVPAMFGVASPFLLVVPAMEKKFDESGRLIDESFGRATHNFLSEFLWLAEKIR